MGTPVQEIYGPIFIGVVFNVALYGIMITQTYLYFTVYKHDRTWMKLFVVLLFLCDTINCCFDVTFLYVPLINNFGSITSITTADWVFATDPFMTAFIAFLVQAFFAWRVKVLTSNVYAVSVIAVCSFVQMCGGLGTSIAVGMIPQFESFQKFRVIVIIWLTFSAVADTLITTALVWHLKRHRTGMPVTDDVVNRIIRLTVQTGLLTALCAIIDLILFLVSPTGLHLIFNLPLSKLYTNSLMSSLNSRAGWQYDSGEGGRSDNRSDKSSAPRVHNVNVNMLRSDHSGRRGPQEIYIDVESHEMVDVGDSKRSPYSPGGTYVQEKAMSPISGHELGQDGGSDPHIA